jgi:hypothetical protein
MNSAVFGCKGSHRDVSLGKGLWPVGASKLNNGVSRRLFDPCALRLDHLKTLPRPTQSGVTRMASESITDDIDEVKGTASCMTHTRFADFSAVPDFWRERRGLSFSMAVSYREEDQSCISSIYFFRTV